MTDNDYIAEYVKEKHAGIIGFDFAMWKCMRIVTDSVKDFFSAFNSIAYEEEESVEEEGDAHD